MAQSTAARVAFLSQINRGWMNLKRLPMREGTQLYVATAMRLVRPLADQGHVTAQTVVGLMYYFNYGGTT
jgi:hypothetical protein